MRDAPCGRFPESKTTCRSRSASMDEAVALLNIKHFKDRLVTETDGAVRRTLLELLSEEEKKLAAARARKQAGHEMKDNSDSR